MTKKQGGSAMKEQKKRRNNEKDETLLQYMNSLEKSMSYVEKMQKVIAWKKKHRDLIGYRISLYPSAKNFSNEEIAKDLFHIELNSAEGKLKKVDLDKNIY